MCGGDIYFYGGALAVKVNGVDMYQDSEYFLGYYQASKIDFTVEIINRFDQDFNGVTLSALPYESDASYLLARFDVSQTGAFSDTILTVGTVPANSSVIVYGRINRDFTADPSDIDPFRFNLKVENS
jgi:hypothetical protein